MAFVSKDIASIIGAADIVVSRSGASFMAELAAIGSSVILIPNAQLVGGHQLKNAKMYSEEDAAVVIDETQLTSEPDILYDKILELIEDSSKRHKLSENLHRFAKPDAAQQVAKLILGAVK